MLRMTLHELEAVLDEHVVRWRSFARIVALGERDITVAMPFQDNLLRAGGTVSGRALMTLTDRAAYYLTIALVGLVPDAVTANLNIHFLARPRAGEIIALARMLRLGRRLAVSSVELFADDHLVAHATVAYALPRDAGSC